MGLLDLIEEDETEGPFPDGVGQLPTGVMTEVPGRGTDQPLGGVLGREFAHVEPDVGPFVTEHQLGQGLGELRLADAGRPGEEEHHPRLQRLGRRLGTRQPHHRPHENVDAAAHCLVLPTDAAPDTFLGLGEPVTQRRLRPGILQDAHPIAPRSVLDAAHGSASRAAQPDYLDQAAQAHGSRLFGEPVRDLHDLIFSGLETDEPAGQRPCRSGALVQIRHRDGDPADSLVRRGQPRRQLPLVVDDPDDRVVSRRPVGPRQGVRRVRQLLAAGEELVLAGVQLQQRTNQPGCVVDHEHAAPAVPGLGHRTQGRRQRCQAQRPRPRTDPAGSSPPARTRHPDARSATRQRLRRPGRPGTRSAGGTTRGPRAAARTGAGRRARESGTCRAHPRTA
jgi:hypothetical protein